MDIVDSHHVVVPISCNKHACRLCRAVAGESSDYRARQDCGEKRGVIVIPKAREWAMTSYLSKKTCKHQLAHATACRPY